eukprot:TRINITY_DN347_c0_g1_i1.p1 TRINITY_DN347_c0_g1~~TRINITY_DN347_c0_g1_i1.p1  ORF type:complete len:358 (-),score=47.15 TRINITY_DN347_c0_g1_i1:103-1176(-)
MSTGLLWYSLLAGSAPILAAAIPFFVFKNGMSQRSIQIVLGLSAGLLFAIATLELIPEAFEMATLKPIDEDTLTISPINTINTNKNHRRSDYTAPPDSTGQTYEEGEVKSLSETPSHDHDHDEGEEDEERQLRIAMVGIGSGFLVLVMVQFIMMEGGHSHSHGGTTPPASSRGRADSDQEEDYAHTKTGSQLETGESTSIQSSSTSLSMVAFVGLAVHSLIDGIVIAGAFSANATVGSRVAVAIVFHKFPDGFVMSSIIAAQSPNRDREKTHPFVYIGSIAAMTPLGALLGALLLGGIPPVATGFVLGFGAGTFLYIVATGILPELLDAKNHRKISLISLVLGYCAFVFIDSNFHAH